MADPNTSDPNTDGFSDTGHGVIAVGGDTIGDYSHWGWKQIEAAIFGGGGVDDDSYIKEPSDPETIQKAADALYYTQRVLEKARDAISAQTEALTGENGPWQGPAAKSLRTAMSGLVHQTDQMAKNLSGGSSHDFNIPQQLANSAAHLRSARQWITDIDNWYAQQALKLNPKLRMSNGLVEVHKNPLIVQLMTRDMLQVLTVLSRNYVATAEPIRQPGSPHNPNSGPGKTNLPNFQNLFDNMPNPFGGIPGPNWGNGPNLGDGFGDGPNLGGDLGGDPNLGGDVGGDPNLGGDLGGDPNLGGDVGGDPNLGGDLSGDPNLSGAPNIKTMAAPDLSSDLPGAGTLDGSGDPSQFPGDLSLDNGGPGLTSPGQFNPAMDEALNPATANDPVGIAPFPTPGLGLDTPGGSGKAAKPTGATVSPFDGGTGLDTPGALDDPNLPTGDGVSPFPGGLSGGLPGLDTAGTDAPGLGNLPLGSPASLPGLDSSAPDLSSLGSPVGDGAVTPFPGGMKLADGQQPGGPAGSMMPMMPMGAGAGAGGLGGEGGPSDASHLLGGDVEPWAGDPSLPDGMTGGADGGGPGLSLPGDDATAVGDPSAALPGDDATAVGDPRAALPGDDATAVGDPSAALPGEGPSTETLGGPGAPMMPMMPMGAGGAAAGGLGGEGGPSDASHLLSGESEPWAGSSSLPDGMTGGADGGGPGLSLPGDAAAAAGDQGLAPLAGTPGDSAAEPAQPMMPMMPMGGMNPAGGGDREHHGSDASGLLSGSTDAWTVTSGADDHGVGSPYGTPPDEGRLTMPGDDGLVAGPLTGQPAQATSSGQGPSQQTAGADAALDAGILAWMPLLAASAGAGSFTGGQTGSGSGDTHTRATDETTGAVWGEPEWGVAGTAAVAGYGEEPTGGETARPRVPAEPHGQAGTPEVAHGPTPAEEPDHRLSDEETPDHQWGEEAAPGHHSGGEAAPGDQPVHEVDAPHHHQASESGSGAWAEETAAVHEGSTPGNSAEDDTAAWDLTDGSLLPLLGPQEGAATGGEAAATDADIQEAAAATAVAAGVYTLARGGTTAEQFTEPARAAWRPKASGPAPVELSCSFAEPEEETQPEPESRPVPARARKKAQEDEEEGKSSVAELLRQGEEVWG